MRNIAQLDDILTSTIYLNPSAATQKDHYEPPKTSKYDLLFYHSMFYDAIKWYLSKDEYSSDTV